MANAAGFIQESIWRDDHWRRLSRTAQALYMQLLSQKEVDCAGILPLQPHKWAKGCNGMTVEQVWADLAELQQERFVFYDIDTDEVLIRTYIKNSNVLKVPNMRKSANRSALLVGSPLIRAVLGCEMVATGHPDFVETAAKINPSGNPSLTVMPTVPEPIGEPTGVGVGVGVNVTLDVSPVLKPSSASPKTAKRTKPRKRIDPAYMPTQKIIDAIKDETGATSEQLRFQHRQFVDYWLGRGEPMADWHATWRRWMRTAHKRGDFGAPTGKPHKLRSLAELAAEVRETETLNGKELQA